MRIKKGYTLISLMLLLATMTWMGVLRFRHEAFDLKIKEAKNEGEALQGLNSAIEGYLVGHGPALRAMQDNDCQGVSACAPSVWWCAPVAGNSNQCELSYTRMIDEGLLPPNWQNATSWGAAYKTIITRVPKSGTIALGGAVKPEDYNLRAITVTSTPWIDPGTGSLMQGMAGQAVKAGGPDLGVTISSIQAQGLVRRAYNAGLSTGTITTWNADPSMNSYLNATGQLVARAGFESFGTALQAGLVRRDGTLAMTGNLNMGSQRVNNAQDAFVKNLGGPAGGKNLSAIAPTWVFKYSWRVADQALIPKPDCSSPSGGWTNRTVVDLLNNPWAPRYNAATDPYKAYDKGEPRILIINDYLGNMHDLGYDASASSWYSGGPYAPGDSYGGPNNSWAYKGKARGAYAFYATNYNTDNWQVFMKYFQDGTTNSASDVNQSRGIASVYCYYDNKVASGCNGDEGCVNSGLGAAGAAATNLASPIASSSSTMSPAPGYVNSLSQTTAITGGAADVVTTF